MILSQPNVQSLVTEMDYPFSFLRNEEYARETESIPGCPTEEIDAFPDNIAEYYWISPGENDEKPWMCLCRLTNDVYVFYKGECDYTGFDCQGDMKIYATRDSAILLERAMTAKELEKYKQDIGAR